MEFENIGDLVNIINTSLGEFCNKFGRTRKELADLGKLPTRDALFKYIDSSRDWAINEGSGTEIQYHIGFNKDDLVIKYGLGFNTQTVQFKHEMSSIEYIKPYMDAFLKHEDQIRHILPDYNFVYGKIESLKNPKHNEYTLFGKTVNVDENGNNFLINDSVFNSIIEDLKKQFHPYKIIFTEKNDFKKSKMNIQKNLSVLTQKGQIILQGPPGTGKTFTAKDIAELMIFSKISEDKKKQNELLESTEQYKLIQFHPAYSYEDFVRGIVAESSEGKIEYLTKNKVFAKFTNVANENYINSFKEPNVLSKEEWFEGELEKYKSNVHNEINDKGLYFLNKTKSFIMYISNEGFQYYNKSYDDSGTGFGISFKNFRDIFLNIPFDADYENIQLPPQHFRKLLIPLLQDFRNFIGDIPENFVENTQLKSLLSYVLIIDEINRANLPAVLGELIYALEYRGEKVDGMYSIDNDYTLTIPPNLYIIGTMNSSDRSVGYIDYAIRRRFSFIDVLPKILNIDSFDLELFKKVSDLFIKNLDEYANDNSVELKVSEHLSEEFRPEDVWLGHSYFIKNEGDISLRIKHEIVPILKEYVKDGILKQSALSLINLL